MLTSRESWNAIGAIILCALAVLLFCLVWFIPSTTASITYKALVDYPASKNIMFLPYVARGIPAETDIPIPTSTPVTGQTTTRTPTRTQTPTNTPTVGPTVCNGASQVLTNPSFEGTIYPWYAQGYPIWNCSVASDGACSVYYAGYNNAMDDIYQTTVAPDWAETGAVYFDWAMLSDDSLITPHDLLRVDVMLLSTTELPKTIAYFQIDNTAPRQTWYWSKVTIPNISQYRGRTLSVMIFAQTDASYPTGWYVDNVRLYFACGSFIAGTEATNSNLLEYTAEAPSEIVPRE